MNVQTPLAAQPHKSELRPLPMRITQLQFERLKDARGRDGLSVQEHVRRSLDLYLAKIEREASKTPNSVPADEFALNGQEQLAANPPLPQVPPPAAFFPPPSRKKPRPKVRQR